MRRADWRADGDFVHVRYVVKEDGVSSSSFFNVHSSQNAAAIVKHHNVFVADLARRLTEQEAEIARLRDKHAVACDTITALQHERAERAEHEVLSNLSFWLSQGAGDRGTSAAEFDKRIRDGVEHLIRPLEKLWHDTRAKLAAAEQALTAARRERDEARATRCHHCGKWLNEPYVEPKA